MQFSKAHLDQFVSNSLTAQELSHQLSMAGLEVDAINPVAGEFSGVFVGQIISADRHPDADKLQVCQVEVGRDAPLQIVCGAKNARKDLIVAVATVGAVLPGDFKIKEAKLRGVESFGMICSESELGLAESSDGIMELPVDAPVGTDIRDYLDLNDHSLEVDLTANRGDCLSVLGLAREVATKNELELKMPEVQQVSDVTAETVDIKIENPEDCPCYMGRVISDINPDAKTPLWMSERLRRAGINLIHPVVDITNYVMITLGQPMHAFDRDKLSGSIFVHKAKTEETLKTLDENDVKLNEQLLISDDSGAIAIAGIMGGLSTSVNNETTSVFLESAHFSVPAIRGQARKLGLNTDSSARFERGVDPKMPSLALDYATQLVIDICGGSAGPISKHEDASLTCKAHTVELRQSKLNKLLGANIETSQAATILNSLGFNSEVKEGSLVATVPSWRFDCRIEEDLIEEVARIIGFDELGSTMPMLSPITKSTTSHDKTLFDVKQQIAARGFHEAITYSFISPKHHEAFFGDAKAEVLENPISVELSIMRQSIIPGLLSSIKHNNARQNERVRLFESGRVFINGAEVDRLALVVTASKLKTNIRESGAVDFFDLKGDLESLFDDEVLVKPLNEAIRYLHPGQSGQVFVGGKAVGFIGQIHPQTLKAFGIKQKVFAFEVDLNAVCHKNVSKYQHFSKFPAIKRDIALLLDENISCEDVINKIREAAGPKLLSVDLFDEYQGENIDSGKKSLAFNLILQDLSHTLNEDDVSNIMNSIIMSVTDGLNAQLRE